MVYIIGQQKTLYGGIINNYNDLDLSLLFYNLYEVLPDETSILMKDSIYLEFMYLSHYYIRTDALKIKPNKLYKLEITYNEELKSYYYFVVPYGTTITSGMTINYKWNSGDSTYTIQDQMQQNEQNNDFWKKAYDSLFVVDSGDVSAIVDNFIAQTNISENTDISGELAILNTLTGEPTDFIINWNDVNWENKTIIPAGQINFSEKVRENTSLQNVMYWARIIMSYSIMALLVSEIWFTLLKCLGVSTSIYEQHNEEIERLQQQEEREEEKFAPKVYATQVKTPNGIKRYVTERRRIK